MQSPQASTPGHRRVAVGLPRNPRQGRTLEQTGSAPSYSSRSGSVPSVPRSDSRPTQFPASGHPSSPQARPIPPRSRTRPGGAANQKPQQRLSVESSQSGSSFSSATSQSTAASSYHEIPAVFEPQASRISPTETPSIAQHDAQSDHVSPIWATVAGLANNLTVNVGLAWASHLASDDREEPETPFGAESRLTKAMKAHHLAKARSVSDLPEWLFTDKERRAPPTTAPNYQDDRGNQWAGDVPAPQRPTQHVSVHSRDVDGRLATAANSAQPNSRMTERLRARRVRDPRR